jgi:dTDP-4-amino-4,6-dideoxygalactose transaminase
MDNYYRSELNGIGDIKFQVVEDRTDANCWLFTFQTKHMRELLSFLNNEGVQSRPFWKPMNELPMFKNYQYVTSNHISSKIYESCISIPSSAGITLEEQDIVISKIKHFYSTL